MLKNMKRFFALLVSLALLLIMSPFSASAATASPIQTISTKGGGGVAIWADGSVVTWGYSDFGEMGVGHPIGTNQRFPLANTGITNARLVSAALTKTLIVTNDNVLYVAGSSGRGEINGTVRSPTVFTRIMDDVLYAEAGYMAVYVVKTDHTLWAWGAPDNGMLANGKTAVDYDVTLTPHKIMDNVLAVEEGGTFVLALRTDNTLWGWGNNTFGQLGVEPCEIVAKPIKIMDNVKSFAAGDSHTLIVTQDGTLYALGNNLYGQLGNGESGGTVFAYDGADSYKPVRVMGEVSEVSASGYLSAAVTIAKTLYLWGQPGGSYAPCPIINGASAASKPTSVLSNIGDFAITANEVLVSRTGSGERSAGLPVYSWGGIAGPYEPTKLAISALPS